MQQQMDLSKQPPTTIPSHLQWCHISRRHLGALNALTSDSRPWAPGGFARNEGGDSLPISSFQMEKAAVTRQLKGQRNEGLDHFIGASYSLG